MSGLFDILSPDLSYQTSDQRVTHAPYEMYAPTVTTKKSLQLDYSYAPVFNISSPGASGSSINTKKDTDLSGDISPSVKGATDTQSAAQAALGGGMDIWTIALIAGAALIGVYFISRRK